MICEAAAVHMQPQERNIQYVINVPEHGFGSDQLYETISNLQEQVNMLSQRLSLLESNHTVTSGVGSAASFTGTNYVRWGRKSCPAGRTLVYTGM